MKNLKTLVMMQLQDKIDTSFMASKKKIIFKVVLTILKFAVITALIYLGLFLVEYLHLVAILPGIPQNFFNFVFTIMVLLSILVCTFGLMKTLYYSKDNQLLLTMPVQRTMVFCSKLIVYYIYECLRNAFYLLPLFVAYGLINHLPFYFFLWAVFALFVVTALLVSVGALLSIPLMFVTNFVKQYKVLGYILLTIVSAGIITGVVFLIDAIPENFDLIGSWGTTFWTLQSFLATFNQIFLPFGWLAMVVVGKRYGISNSFFTGEQFLILLGVLATIIVIFAIAFLVVKPLYFKMTSSPFEYKKVKVQKKFKNTRVRPFFSSIKKDIILYFRSPDKLFAFLAVIIGLPIAIFLLNKIYSAMNTRLTGAHMTIAFNILVMLFISLATNGSISHIYSEEGASSYLMKTNPQSQLKLLFSKLVINISLTSISLLVSVIVFSCFSIFNAWQTILMYLVVESVYLSHALWSAEMDLMNPQTAQYKTTGGHVNNPNEIKSTITSLILSALFAFLTYFFIRDGTATMWYRILLFAGLFLALRIWLYVNKIKVYYKEMQP